MSERRAVYLTHRPQPDTRICSCTFDLGQHSVEVREDQTILLVKRTEWNAMVQLESEEAYRLLLVLHELFQRGSERQAKG